MRNFSLFLLCASLFLVGWTSQALAEPITVNGQGATLSIDSPCGAWLTYPADISYPTYDVYEFAEDDGVDYTVDIMPGYTAVTIYLYHGDGTGQFIEEDVAYNHVTGLHTNLKPAVVIVYDDESVEELVAPELWEGYFSIAQLPPSVNYPSSFSPPVTAVAAINSALSNNGHTPIPQAMDAVVSGVVDTLHDGTQVVWVLWPDNYRELYFLYTDGSTEPLNGLNGRPICYCSCSSCREFQTKNPRLEKCNAGYLGNNDDQGRKIIECITDDGYCE